MFYYRYHFVILLLTRAWMLLLFVRVWIISREVCNVGVSDRGHRITESQNGRGWKAPHGSSSPTLLPKQGHLQQAAQDLVQAGLEYLQRRRLHSLPGQPVPVLRHPQREKRRLREDLLTAFQYLKGAYRKAGEGHITRACSDRTSSKVFKLKEVSFGLEIRKKLFTMRVVRHWNMLPREVVAAPFLEEFKARMRLWTTWSSGRCPCPWQVCLKLGNL